MTDMVERVARGILHRRHPMTRPEDMWLDPAALEDARAAIEAMRESLLMELRKEAHAYGNNDPEKIGFESATAMIDAALSPNQKG